MTIQKRPVAYHISRRVRARARARARTGSRSLDEWDQSCDDTQEKFTAGSEPSLDLPIPADSRHRSSSASLLSLCGHGHGKCKMGTSRIRIVQAQSHRKPTRSQSYGMTVMTIHV